MSGRDGWGPAGEGPATGWGRGGCASVPSAERGGIPRFGRFRPGPSRSGRERGRGRRGCYQSFGRGLEGWNPPHYKGWTLKEEKAALQAALEYVESELKAAEKNETKE